MTQAECTICRWIGQIQKQQHPGFVSELKTGYVILAEHQYFKGYCLFLAKKHLCELHELEPQERRAFMEELAMISEAVYRAFSPKKLNYELLGNLTPHMHWHVIPRYGTDPAPDKSIWELDKAVVFGDDFRLTPEKAAELKKQLLAHLTRS